MTTRPADTTQFLSSTDFIPPSFISEARADADAPAALAYLARRGQSDLADMLGIGGVA